MSFLNSSWAAAIRASVLPLLPGIAAVLAAVFIDHPAVLILLLLAQAPLAAGATLSLGYQLDQGFLGLMLRRGSLLLIWIALYASWVAAVIGTPALQLISDGSASNAVLLSMGFLLALAALIRLWPVFGLSLLWDDAYPESASGSWIVTAFRRVASFAWHLTGEVHEHSFGSGVTVTFALLLLIIPALSIAGLCGTLPSELRDLAVWIYALLCCPLAHLLVFWRTERLLLSDEEAEAQEAAALLVVQAASAVSAVAEPATATARQNAALDDRDATLLNACAGGNVAQALELLTSGADPNVLPGRNDRDQRSPLMSAVCHSDLRLLRALIERGASPDLAVNGVTPLLLACRDTLVGRPEAVMMLLSNGADLTRTGADGCTPLHHAAITRDPGIAAMLLDAGAVLDPVNAEGLTPLGVAARAANEAVLKLLLDRGAVTEAPRALPVLIAAAAGADDQTVVLKRLLKARANVHALDKLGRTALHVAALHGHGEMVEVLIGAGADVNARDAHGVTPLMEAARAGANRALQRLVFRKPDPAFRDGNGRTALHLACQSKQANADTVSALLGVGADPLAQANDGKRPVDLAAALGRWQMVQLLDPHWPVPAAVAEDTQTQEAAEAAEAISEAERLRLLAEALRCGRLPIARELLDLEPRIAAPVLAQLVSACFERDQSQGLVLLLQFGLPLEAIESPLLRAIRHTPLPLECIRAALAAGAAPGAGALLPLLAGVGDDEPAERRALVEDIALEMIGRGADVFGSDSQGRNLLHHAALAPWPRLLPAALARGLDPNARDARGNTPLHHVLARRQPQIAALTTLIRHGADPTRAAGDGQTGLGLALQAGRQDLAGWLRWNQWVLPGRALRDGDVADAARQGDLEAARKLVELGLDINGRDTQGCTALLRAAGGGHAALVEWLLAQGADTQLGARTGATPLSAAVSARQESIVARLIAAGAAVDQTLPGAITPLMIAAALGFDAIAQSLLIRGAQAAAVDDQGNTALHAAVQFAWASKDIDPAKRLIECLLDAGAPINAQNQEGSSALLLLLGARADAGTPALNRKLKALVQLLLARGADLEVQDRRGVSVLHAAAMHGMVDITEALLGAGADTRRTDVLGRSAHEVAVLLGYVDLAARLKRS